MLEKTREMLVGLKAGTYLPDDAECYDDEEVTEFARLCAGLVYAPSKLRRKLQSLGVTITRSDFYSEVPTIAELEASFSRPTKLLLNHPFRDAEYLRQFLCDLTPFGADFEPPLNATNETEYAWNRGGVSYSDAMAYYCMIRRYQPKTIIELGCGVSTLIASLACARNGQGRIIAIEPYPAPFLYQAAGVEVVQTRAQDLDEAFVDENLSDGDLLFIDTTHTVKHDSDCLHIYLRILPFIKSRIFVHAHDIYLPGSLPLHMMRDSQLFWNEQYLLYAYLIGNPRTKVLYGSAYHNTTNQPLLKEFMRERYPQGGGSLWFSQSGPVA